MIKKIQFNQAQSIPLLTVSNPNSLSQRQQELLQQLSYKQRTGPIHIKQQDITNDQYEQFKQKYDDLPNYNQLQFDSQITQALQVLGLSQPSPITIEIVKNFHFDDLAVIAYTKNLEKVGILSALSMKHIKEHCLIPQIIIICNSEFKCETYIKTLSQMNLNKNIYYCSKKSSIKTDREHLAYSQIIVGLPERILYNIRQKFLAVYMISHLIFDDICDFKTDKDIEEFKSVMHFLPNTTNRILMHSGDYSRHIASIIDDYHH